MSQIKKVKTLDFLRIAPVRGAIINEDYKGSDPEIPKAMEFFFNPDVFNFKTASSWARIAVPGLSHEVLQWSHNPSNEMSFRLQWDWTIALRREKGLDYSTLPKLTDKKMEDIRSVSYEKAMQYRDFLYGLTLPVERGRAPSRVTVVWPGVIHIRGVITSVDFRFTRFHHDGGVIAFDADVSFVELRRVFLSRQGTKDYFNRAPEEPSSDQLTQVKKDRKVSSKGRTGSTSEQSTYTMEERIKKTWDLNDEKENATISLTSKAVSPYRL